MDEQSADSAAPDGSTDRTEDERRRTAELPDGSPSGDATEDPEQDSDTDSGGEPEPPEHDPAG
jgi:hypothetical protein